MCRARQKEERDFNKESFSSLVKGENFTKPAASVFVLYVMLGGVNCASCGEKIYISVHGIHKHSQTMPIRE